VLAAVRRLDIVLTHFHLDHVAGLAYLPAIGVCEQTTVWFTRSAPRNPNVHSSGEQAAKVAAAAGADRLLVIHLPPFERSLDGLLLEVESEVPRAQPAHDGLELPQVAELAA
jgi:ribonuclease BN (tRNA processing enzyme)